MTKIFLIHGLEPNTDKEIEIKNELVLVITCLFVPSDQSIIRDCSFFHY